MSARSEVENNIQASWKDKKVARWVISNLPLLKESFTHSPCPVFTLSLDDGLQQKSGPIFSDFRWTPKIVMSGGFEGTKGHVLAAKEMWETRALRAEKSPLVIMLEPDSYIANQKGRKPIVDIKYREKLWSTSNLVDALILLPEKKEGVSVEQHYLGVHEQIAPALWCANVENRHWLEIIYRGLQQTEPFDLNRLYIQRPQPHTSFVAATRDLSAREVKKALYPYILGIVRSGTYQLPHFLTDEQTAQILFEEIKRGL
jgi:hypothetical protein